EQFGDLDALFAAVDTIKQPKMRASIAESDAAVRRAFELVGLRDDAELPFDLEELRYGTRVDTETLRALFTDLQFTRFLEMLEDLEEAPPAEKTEYGTILDAAALEALAEAAK